MKFLGTYRPNRLLDDAKKIWENAPLNYIRDSEIVSIKPFGRRKVMGLSTSTQTYIANGLFSHNSQFSFGRFNGELRTKSKGANIEPLAPPKTFKEAVEVAGDLSLMDGWTYRAEVLCKPKHNALAYDRCPNKGMILFDVNDGYKSYLSYNLKKAQANYLGLEVVPKLYEGMITDPAQSRKFLATSSILGGQLIEGVVIKNYSRFGMDGHALIGKFVSESFKEVQKGSWRQDHPTNKDVLQILISRYGTQARWQKAIQHLSEIEQLENSPRDIGSLIKEIQRDILDEEENEIKEALFNWAKKDILRGVISGFPEWYKQKLLEEQFNV